MEHAEYGEFALHVLTNGKFREHTYLVEHRASAAALLIDPGHTACERVQAHLARGVRIERVLLTHGHFDHVGGVQPLCDALDLAADAHAGDRALMRQAQLYSVRWERTFVPIPKRLAFFEGEPTFTWSGGTVETIAAPGHTAGSVAYRIGPMVFTGDTLFRRKVGPTYYPTADREELLRSVARILERVPADAVLHAGHGRSWSAGDARAWWETIGGAPETFDIYHEQGESPAAAADGTRDAD